MARDFRVESYLEQQGVDFRYVDTAFLHEFDLVKSIANQARFEALNESVYTSYATAMLNGAEFPAVVAYQAPSGYVLIGGNHRLKAADLAGREAVDVYVVTTSDPDTIDRLTRSINQIEGVRLSAEEALAQAVYRVNVKGEHETAVAKDFAIPIGALTDAVQSARVRDRMDALGLATFSIPKTNARRLHPLLSNDKVLRAAAKVTAEAVLPHEMVGDLVMQVRAKRTEEDQLQVIADYATRPEVKDRIERTRRGAVKRPGIARSRNLIMSLAAAATTLERYPHDTLATTLDELDRIVQEWDRVSAGMARLINTRRVELGYFKTTGTARDGGTRGAEDRVHSGSA